MAERRMFAKSVITSDVFLDMPLSTQALYMHLNMDKPNNRRQVWGIFNIRFKKSYFQL